MRNNNIIRLRKQEFIGASYDDDGDDDDDFFVSGVGANSSGVCVVVVHFGTYMVKVLASGGGGAHST